LLAVLFAASSALGQSPGQNKEAEAQDAVTADDVVAAYLQAIGGADALRSINSKRVTYWVHMFGRDAYLMERSWTRPNTMRTGPPGTDAHTLTEGGSSWRVDDQGRRELPAAVAGSLSKAADIDGPLVDSTEKGITLSYSGIVRYDMAELHHVTLTYEDGVDWELFFDARTGLLRKIIRPSFRMLNGEISRGSDTHTYYYDYRTVGGVLYPHCWIQATDDHTHLFIVEEMKLGE
jgi:hypothetical protein